MTKRFGELLNERVEVDPSNIDRALRLQKESGERLGSLLVKLGLISERDLAVTLARQLDLQLAAPNDYPDVAVLGGQVSPDFLRQVKAAPIRESDEEIVIAFADPLDNYAVQAIGLAVGRSVQCWVGLLSEVEAAIERQYGGAEVEDVPDTDAIGGFDDSAAIEQLRDLASEEPIIKLVNQLIGRAVRLRASDIHVEPFEDALHLRYRIDGVLQLVDSPPVHSSAAVISRIKVMANLNIAERRLPQDGRIRLRTEGKEIDMRVSTLPTMYGESVVIRLLDKSSLVLDFEQLGFSEDSLAAFEAVLAIPHGIVLVTGPTGSGKTTTLYAALSRLNSPDKKMLTVEDPIEYQLTGINQIAVKPDIGMTFAHALRSILRQDPDVIMIGEMRDAETGQIAVQAALTGHKVFSTLHTNSAAASVTRLLNMGLEDYLLSSTLNAVLAQRLVRTLCEDCKEPYTPPSSILDKLEASDLQVCYRAIGCEHCAHTGYRGRTTILELLTMTDNIRGALSGDARMLMRVAMEDGMVPMRLDGIRKVARGTTTLEEVLRVTEEV